MALCRTCAATLQSIVIRAEPDWREEYPHHTSVDTFLDAAAAKSYVCWRLHQHADQEFQALLEEIAEVERRIVASSPNGVPNGVLTKLSTQKTGDYSTVSLSFPLDGDTEEWQCEELRRLWQTRVTDIPGRARYVGNIYLSLSLVPRWLVEPHVLGSSTGSDETLTLAKGWIHDCITTHKSCAEMKSASDWYPTRLIDLGGSSASAQPTSCKLVLGCDVTAGAKYMTLSHRWGTANVAKLTISNLHSWMHHRLPVETFSQTFLEFFNVARRTAYPLCLDRLPLHHPGRGCRRRLARRGVKDGQGVCQLVLQRVSSLECGVWWSISSRDPEHINMPELDVYAESETPAVLDGTIKRLFTRKSRYYLMDHQIWTFQVELSPLSARGWVFFECLEAASSESIPRRLLQTPIHCDSPLTKKLGVLPDNVRQTLQNLGGHIPNGVDTYYYTWASIASRYSGLALTYPDADKLVAIAGIARFLKQRLNNDIYIAGLWFKYLGHQMLWSADASASKTTTPTPTLFTIHRSPSFSWAATNLSVNCNGMPGYASEILPELKCIHYRSSPSSITTEQEVTEDVFGPISSPTVDVRAQGTLRPVQLKDIGDYALHVFPAGLLAMPPLEPMLSAVHGGRKHSGIAVLDFHASLSASDIMYWEGKKLYAMDWEAGKFAWGFLSLEAVDVTMSRYRRVGMFSMSATDYTDALEAYLTWSVDEKELQGLGGYDNETGR